jgi:hypothetical protein
MQFIIYDNITSPSVFKELITINLTGNKCFIKDSDFKHYVNAENQTQIPTFT